MTTKEKTRESTRKRSDVVYTQPKPFQRRRFVLHLATAVAVVLALVLGMAIFFKVKAVRISGADKYTVWEIREASGIQDGDNLMTLNKAKIAAKIRTEKPYVDEVRISITLPDTVNIQVKERSVFYCVQATDETWWLMGADAKVIEKITDADTKNHTKIVGVRIAGPKAGHTAVAEEIEQEETLPDGETVPVTVYGSEKLQAATAVLSELERNSILGVMTSLDVTDIHDIEMWRGDRFRVQVGDTTRLGEKILALKAYFQQYGEKTSVVLDISFTNSKDEYYYKPWSDD